MTWSNGETPPGHSMERHREPGKAVTRGSSPHLGRRRPAWIWGGPTIDSLRVLGRTAWPLSVCLSVHFCEMGIAAMLNASGGRENKPSPTDITKSRAQHIVSTIISILCEMLLSSFCTCPPLLPETSLPGSTVLEFRDVRYRGLCVPSPLSSPGSHSVPGT